MIYAPQRSVPVEFVELKKLCPFIAVPALPPKADIATIKQMSAKGNKWTFGHSLDHLSARSE
jgi:hypothetical protein